VGLGSSNAGHLRLIDPGSECVCTGIGMNTARWRSAGGISPAADDSFIAAWIAAEHKAALLRT